MNLDYFFSFHSKLISTAFKAPPICLKMDYYDKLRIGDYKDISFPVKFKQESGKKLYDILDTGSASFYLISERMKRLLEEFSLTGWKTYCIELCDINDIEIHNYYGFSVIGKCGPIDYSKSRIVEKRLVPSGPVCHFYKGMYIDLDTWDESDFFIPENRNGIIITSSAADLLKKNKITNIELKNLEDFESMID